MSGCPITSWRVGGENLSACRGSQAMGTDSAGAFVQTGATYRKGLGANALPPLRSWHR